ncbi:nuclear transport factor 2 family protein [Streptosporangium sp. NPDC051022]|uniref:nuclear transport factor 2 family protein n=1 Tax=Streptosporangium sp. NPDC051022 TaxID=3155752 RepID=UPI00343E3DD6
MTETNELVDRLEALEARVRTLDAEAAITKTLYRLAITLDYGDHEAWIDCFAPDAVFEMVEVSETDRVVRVRHDGRDALAAFIPGHSHAPQHFHKHLVGDPLIEITGDGGDTATSTSYLTRLDKGEAGPYLWSFGRYLDTFVRGDDGRWRVARRTIEVESRAVPVKASDIGAR